MNKTKVYSYIRFSTSRQESGDSVRRQLEIARNYSEKVGGVYQDRSFSDMGISAFKQKERDGLQMMLDMVEDGSIEKGSHIVIERLDRLSRQGISVTQQLITQIVQHGVLLYVAGDNMLLERDSLNDLSIVIRVAVAADLAYKESLQKSQRIKASKIAKKKDGLDGRVTKKVCPFWLKFDEKKQEYVFSDKLPTIQRIIELRQQGFGENKMAQHLNDENVPPPRAAKWSPTSLRKLYTHPAIYGAWQTTEKTEDGKYINSDLIENYYPALLTYEEFMLMNPKSKATTAKDSGLNPFKGLLRCAKCGATMSRQTSKMRNGEKYVAYRCTNAGKGIYCDAVGYRDMDKYLVAACKRLKIKKTLSSDNREKESQLRALEAKLDSLQQAILTQTDITALISTSQIVERQINELKATIKPAATVTVDELYSHRDNPQSFNLLARSLIQKVEVEVKAKNRHTKTLFAKFYQHNGYVITLTVLPSGDAFYSTTDLSPIIDNEDYEEPESTEIEEHDDSIANPDYDSSSWSKPVTQRNR
ncbi:recombinase family protein [Vibrio parahaemolyticus]|uniref:recombinase family protein n=1 Tax=Vibrio alginolyticus TaxID=663 RepID=UPI002AFD68A6|nr:recombinase family protein [Vibrio alginolyticus]